KISCSSNLNKELESCSNTLVSSTNSLRWVTGRRFFFSFLTATTARAGGSGTMGAMALGRAWAGAWRLAEGSLEDLPGCTPEGLPCGEPERVAGVLISGASGIAAEVGAETMAPMRVGNFGSGIKGVLLWFCKVATW